MMKSRSNLTASLAALVALSALASAVSDSAGYVPPKRQSKRKPTVRGQILEQGLEVQEWNAAVQAKRDAKLARKGRA